MLTETQSTILARHDAAFAQTPRTEVETLKNGIEWAERRVSMIRKQQAEHAAWREAMAITNPGALVLHGDRRDSLQRHIDSAEALAAKCRAKLAELGQ